MALAQDHEKPSAAKHEISVSDAAAAQAYWTAERMANAKPMPIPTLDAAIAAAVSSAPAASKEPAQFSPAGLPRLSGSKAKPIEDIELLNRPDAAVQASPLPQTSPFSYVYPFTNYRPGDGYEYPVIAVGKLFFTIPAGASEPAGDYVCSASVAWNAYTVFTARHCMFDYSTGIWYNSWVFDPGYNSGPVAKYGNGWTPNRLITWISGASTFDYDIGVMQMHDENGTGCNGSSGTSPIGDYTGWFGATWNGDYTQRQWDIFGYPAESPYGGAHVWKDEAATGLVNPEGTSNVVEVGNPQTGGTSGGPWIIGLQMDSLPLESPANSTTLTAGSNYLNGLNSFKWTNPSQPYAINGPAFMTYNFDDLVTAYLALSCP